MNEFLTNLLDSLGFAWWVEITTDNPRCVYYFGPFLSAKDAKAHQGGYVEDLDQEGAQNILVNVKRYKPKNLTVYDEQLDQLSRPHLSGMFSSQV